MQDCENATVSEYCAAVFTLRCAQKSTCGSISKGRELTYYVRHKQASSASPLRYLGGGCENGASKGLSTTTAFASWLCVLMASNLYTRKIYDRLDLFR